MDIDRYTSSCRHLTRRQALFRLPRVAQRRSNGPGDRERCAGPSLCAKRIHAVCSLNILVASPELAPGPLSVILPVIQRTLHGYQVSLCGALLGRATPKPPGRLCPATATGQPNVRFHTGLSNARLTSVTPCTAYARSDLVSPRPVSRVQQIVFFFSLPTWDPSAVHPEAYCV
jgi:hypothetical protein